MNLLVLITGTGRSGTSTMSGTLHHLGLSVPGPHLGANASNPKGFFESSWAVAFHKRITAAARINDFDSRPGAFARTQAVLTPQLREELTTFLAEKSAGHPQVVVKDPRSVWAQTLWREAAADAGLEIRYISMLRHPAEVVGSRATYYAKQAEEDQRHTYETFNVARWVNSSVLSERETRGQVRAFVRYTDLLEDWRPVLARLGSELGLSYDSDLAEGVPSPVDEFIDPGLRRHQVTWDDLDVPADLQDVAQRVWDDVSVLGDSAGVDPSASADLDLQAERYARIFADATAVSHDAIEEAKDEARRAGAKAARKKPSAPAPAPALEDRPLRDVGGRDLLRTAVGRLTGRISGRIRGR
ncbi:sulfotransferase family protein [Nocardioides sp.]|uniref:sulfotransferase family protein n=1 Tax=Nocardioides sp. TaxID=35761 RepID=UPI003D0E0AF1